MNKDITYNHDPLDLLQTAIKKCISDLFPLEKEATESISLISPPSHIKADYCFSTFSLGKTLKQDPVLIAKNITGYLSKINHRLIRKVSVLGAYINIETEKKIYSQDTLQYILKKQERFSATKNKKTQKVCINYFLPELMSSCDESRLMLVGKVIGKCFELLDKQVTHNCYFFNRDTKNTNWKETRLEQIKKLNNDLNLPDAHYAIESDFIEKSKEIIKLALELKSAEYIASTNAIATLDSINTPSAVLQKYDGSTTSLSHHLAYLKNIYKSATTDIVFLCSQEDANIIDSILANAKKIKLMPAKISVSTTTVLMRDDKSLYIKPEAPYQYEILRTSLHKNVDLTKKPFSYFQIQNFLEQLRQCPETSSLDLEQTFPIIKLLLNFTRIVDHVAYSHDPSLLPLYLEQLYEECRKIQASENKQLSIAVGLVLQNGLRLLIS